MQQKKANPQQMKIITTRLFPTRKIRNQEVLSRQMRRQQQQLQRWKLTQIQKDHLSRAAIKARKIPHCHQH